MNYEATRKSAIAEGLALRRMAAERHSASPSLGNIQNKFLQMRSPLGRKCQANWVHFCHEIEGPYKKLSCFRKRLIINCRSLIHQATFHKLKEEVGRKSYRAITKRQLMVIKKPRILFKCIELVKPLPLGAWICITFSLFAAAVKSVDSSSLCVFSLRPQSRGSTVVT